MTIRFILLDIEGTTTSVDFVHQVLFPYSADHLGPFVTTNAHRMEVKECLQSVVRTVKEEDKRDISEVEAMEVLQDWIRDDRKHTALKELQGMVWRDGYKKGAFQSHVYSDVPKLLEQWQRSGLSMGIYSSGSVDAQRLLFGYTILGNLNPYFSRYFDTRVGGKREVDSYRKIVESLEIPPGEILFLSDIVEELDAATEAGIKTLQINREGRAVTSDRHPVVKDFHYINLDNLHFSLSGE